MSADKDMQGSNEILETDIVFDCPHCQKSLAIDYRAAGLAIPCSDCQKTVEVPIPEGMDISDLDSSDDDLRVRAIHLREALKDGNISMSWRRRSSAANSVPHSVKSRSCLSPSARSCQH
jgi:transcription elongation factor Elf1